MNCSPEKTPARDGTRILARLAGAAVWLCFAMPLSNWLPEDTVSSRWQWVAASGLMIASVWFVALDKQLALVLILTSIQLGSGWRPGLAGRTLVLGPFDIMCFVMGLACVVSRSNWRPKADRIESCMYIFLFIGTLGGFIAADSLRWLAGLRYVVQTFLGYFVARRMAGDLTDPKKFRVVFSSWAVLAGVSCVGSLLYHPMGVEFATHHKLADTPWARSNYLASFLLLVLPLATEAAVYSKVLSRAVLGASASMACLFSLALTTSKGALLVATAAYLPYLVIIAINTRRPLAFVLLGVIALGVPIYFIAIESIASGSGHLTRLLNLVSLGNLAEQSTAFDRIDLWEEQVAYFEKSPLIGNGFYNTLSARAGSSGSEEDISAHSWFFQCLGETGILGLTVFVILLLLAFVKVLGGRSAEPVLPSSLRQSIAISLAMAILHGLMEGNVLVRDFGFMFWFMPGVAASGQTCRVKLRDPNDSSCSRKL